MHVDELARRLPWLLVFRASVATALFLLTLAVDFADLPLRSFSPLLYGVVIATYMLVLVLGLLLRTAVSPAVLSAVHLAAAVLTALMVVEGTGGIDSAFSFLYLLAIIDGAIIGGGRIALVVATACSLSHGLHLTLQLYGVLEIASDEKPSPSAFTGAVVTHLVAFYLTALLAGRLGELLRRAHEAASTAQTDLMRAERLHEAVLDSLPVGVITFDAHRILQMANPAAERLLGIGTAPGVYTSVPKVVLPFLDSEHRQAEHRLWIRGEDRSLSMRRSPVQSVAASAEVTPEGLEVLVVEDRTEIRALEATLRSKERMASIGQLSAALAHELRNPLAAISGSIEMLHQGNGGNDGDRERLSAILLREIDRLNTLVSDFLAYARPAPADRLPVDLALLVRELCDVVRQDQSSTGHVLELDAPSVLDVHVDPGQIRQLLWNLIKNAFDASPEGAPVRVTLSVGALERGECVRIEIIDRGPGIDPGIRDRLFEPFCTTKPTGTGLGLAVVHSIVEAHGGFVELDAPSGAGTTARVVLPRQ